MTDDRRDILVQRYMTNLQVQVSLSGITRVSPLWRDIDYTPDYSKFYYILDGEGWLRIGDRDYYPEPGQLFLMPQGIRQSYSVIGEFGFSKMWCHFTARTGGMSLFDLIQVPCFIEVDDAGLVRDLFEQLDENARSQDPLAPLNVQSCLLRLLFYYVKQAAPHDLRLSRPEKTRWLQAVLTYIEDHYSDPITINDLARIAYLHPNHFIRVFRRSIGLSPLQYINGRRMEEAKKLLTSSDLTLREISGKIGMADSYYLSRVFKEYTGFSPSAYKEMHDRS